MIRQAYLDTLEYFKGCLRIIFGILLVLFIIAIPVLPTYWLVTTYLNNLLCTLLGAVVDFVIVVFIFNLLFIWLDSKKKKVD